MVDATCTPADITFPTDLKILNTSREKSEEIIDVLHKPNKDRMKKHRTYRIKARRNYLAVAKSKKVDMNRKIWLIEGHLLGHCQVTQDIDGMECVTTIGVSTDFLGK